VDCSESSRHGITEEHVAVNSGEEDGKVEDDLDRHGGQCSTAYVLEELKAKKNKKMM